MLHQPSWCERVNWEFHSGRTFWIPDSTRATLTSGGNDQQMLPFALLREKSIIGIPKKVSAWLQVYIFGGPAKGHFPPFLEHLILVEICLNPCRFCLFLASSLKQYTLFDSKLPIDATSMGHLRASVIVNKDNERVPDSWISRKLCKLRKAGTTNWAALHFG